MPPEVTDRQFALGLSLQPQAPIDFGVTNAENVRHAYEGKAGYQKDGPMTNLRAIARIDPAYLMVAAVRSSGITDLHQIAEKKMPGANHGGRGRRSRQHRRDSQILRVHASGRRFLGWQNPQDVAPARKIRRAGINSLPHAGRSLPQFVKSERRWSDF
jgi:hypothetical protein